MKMNGTEQKRKLYVAPFRLLDALSAVHIHILHRTDARVSIRKIYIRKEEVYF